MSNPVTVRKVENRADFKSFFEFPWILYKDDPNWVPPLLSMRRDLLDREKNPSWEYLEGDYFAAWRGDNIVGTIAAFINHRHNEFHGEHIGWFGFFETYNDTEAANALLNIATEWVRSRGYDAIRGPQSFTPHEECGLLVDGFTRPVLLMPYNPPYYQTLVESAGFQKVMDVYSFYYRFAQEDYEQSAMAARLKRLARGIRRRTKNVVIRSIDQKNLDNEFALFKDIYNSAWEQNWGFTPMTNKELDNMVEGLGQFFDPDLACFVEVDSDPVGFLMGIPDFNQVLQRANPRPGVPEPLTLVKALWHWKIQPCINWMRIPLMGVKPAYRNRGFDLLMYEFILNRLGTTPYEHVDSGWILETNRDLLATVEVADMETYKTHRFYEKRLKLQEQ